MSLRAWGGGELCGDKLVRIVYLDEAGTSRDEPIAIVAGVIVHGDHQLRKLRQALIDVMERHIPEPDREHLVLHTCDIYGGNGYFDKKRKAEWADANRRWAILDDIARIPADLNLVITWGPIRKDEFPALRLKEAEGAGSVTDLQLVVGAAYMVCLFEIDLWFRQNAKQENCLVIVEDNRDTRQFIKAMHQSHQSPAILTRNYTMDEDKDYLPLRHIQEDPGFQEKRVAHPLILADFIAYFVKRKLIGDEQSLRFSDPWIRLTAGLKTRALRDRGLA